MFCATQRRKKRGRVGDVCRFVGLAAMRNRREPRTIGFDEQPIVRYSCRATSRTFSRIAERDDARDRHIPAEIERPARERPMIR